MLSLYKTKKLLIQYLTNYVILFILNNHVRLYLKLLNTKIIIENNLLYIII